MPTVVYGFRRGDLLNACKCAIALFILMNVPAWGTGLDSLAQERFLSEAERRGQAREKIRAPTGCCNQKNNKTLQAQDL